MTPWQDSSKPASWTTFTVPTRVGAPVRITPHYYEDLHDIGGCIFDYFTGESVQQDWIEQNAHGVIRFVVECPNYTNFTAWTPLVPDATDSDLPTYRGTFRTALGLICSDPRLGVPSLCDCLAGAHTVSGGTSTCGLGIYRDKCPDCWVADNDPDGTRADNVAETLPADHGERCTLIHALYHLDRNGCYSDHDRLLEFGRILTTEQLRELHRNLSGK